MTLSQHACSLSSRQIKHDGPNWTFFKMDSEVRECQTAVSIFCVSRQSI